MKHYVFMWLPLFFITCAGEANELEGKWAVDSKHYRATYDVFESDGEWKAMVLYYNDDTYKYEHDSDTHYIFNNLIKEDELYVDGVSGATTSTGNEHTYELKLIHTDTLEVKSWINKEPITEKWIRLNTSI